MYRCLLLIDFVVKPIKSCKPGGGYGGGVVDDMEGEWWMIYGGGVVDDDMKGEWWIWRGSGG